MARRRAAVRAVSTLAAAFVCAVAPGGELLLHDNGNASTGAVASVVRVDAMGNEVSGGRALDDFVLEDLDGSGVALVVTSATGYLTSTAAPAGTEEILLEFYEDTAGLPGALLSRVTGEITFFLGASGTFFYTVDFDAFAVALQPGERYWAAIVVRTPQASTQSYARRGNGNAENGLRAKVVLAPSGGIVEHPFPINLTQVLRGYQVEACPTGPIEGVVGVDPPAFAPSKWLSQEGRARRSPTGGPPDSCFGAAGCSDPGSQVVVNLHSFVNASPIPVCIVATYTESCETIGSRMAAYRGDYFGSSVCTNAAAQSVDTSDLQEISFLIGPGEVFHIVVAESSFGSGQGCAYTLWVRGLSDCCSECPGDANGDGEIDFDDIVGVLGNWQGECEEAPVGP